MQTFCFSLFVKLDLMVVVSFCYNLLSLLSNSMARTKTMPKKEREGRIVLRLSKEWARLAREARQEGERSERARRRRWLARWARKEKEEEKRHPSPVHYPSPAKRSSPTREVAQMLEEMVKWVEEAGQAGGGVAITIIIANPTVGPDGCRGRAICLGGGACPKEALPYHQGQGPTEGVPKGREGKEDQEVLAWHSCPS